MIGLGVGVNRRRFAGGFAESYSSRVIADDGTIEALTCVAAASSLLQSASLLLIPSGYKAGVAYAELPANGNGDLTWSRASDAFRTNASGVLQRVPWNLLQRSEEFSNAIWSKMNSSITANIINAPNGTLTADKLVEDSTNNIHYNTQQITNSNSLLTYSLYAKAGERTFLRINAFATSPNNFSYVPFAFFNLSNGTVGTTSGCNASIQNVGDGWYRCTMQCISVFASTSASVNFYNYVQLTDSVFSYQGDGTSGIYIWGAQLVEGTTAQTYLPTTDRLNFPRLDYTYGSCPALLLEPQRTNSLRNSTMQGASTSPSTLPTNWASVNNGITHTIVGVGTENEIPYVDVRFNGTATGTDTTLRFESNTQIVASSGQTWASTFYTKLISASSAPLSYSIGAYQRTSIGTFVDIIATPFTPTSTLTRVSNVVTISNVTVARVQPTFLATITNGASYDFTIRIAAPQIELGAYATTWINTTNAAATRLADSFTRNNIYTNGLISASGGTWYVELRNNIAYMRDASGESLGIGDTISIGTNALTLRNGSSVGSVRLSVFKYISGVSTSLFTTTTDTVKIAIKWNGTSADVFANGTKVVSATSFTPTNMEFFRGFGQQVPNFIQAMALYPTPLSDAQCQTLTT